MKNSNLKFMGLAVVLFTGLMAGCSGNGNSTADNSPESTITAVKATASAEPATASAEPAKVDNPFAQHMDLSVSYIDIQNAIKPGANDALLKAIEEKFNITIKPVNFGWSDYSEKGKLWAASSQMPDVMFSDAMDTDLASKWADQGITQNLPTDLSKYPNLQKLMNMPDVKGYFTEKGISFIPRPLASLTELPGDRTLIVRKDWMQKLGITQDPGTYDELKKMLTEMVKNNPDGKKDVVGIAIKGSFLGNVLQNAAPLNGWWTKQDGIWKPSVLAPDFVEYVKLMHDFYQAGLIDKDFAIPNQDADGKFAQGKAGMLLDQGKNLRQIEDKWKQYNPNVKFEDAVALMKPVPASDGSQNVFSFYSFWSGTVIKADVDAKKMDRILSLYDYLLSDEGRKLSMYGLKDIDWKMDGDKLVITREKDASGNLPGLMTKYPSADLFANLAAWIGYEGNIYGNADHPGESDYTYNTRTKYDQEMLATGKPLGINWKVNAFVSTFPRTVAKIDVNAELTKIMTAGNIDVEKAWADVVKKIEQNEKEVMNQTNTKFKDES
jgi:putative aldouronate transport system substrate-binding protein